MSRHAIDFNTMLSGRCIEYYYDIAIENPKGELVEEFIEGIIVDEKFCARGHVFIDDSIKILKRVSTLDDVYEALKVVSTYEDGDFVTKKERVFLKKEVKRAPLHDEFYDGAAMVHLMKKYKSSKMTIRLIAHVHIVNNGRKTGMRVGTIRSLEVDQDNYEMIVAQLVLGRPVSISSLQNVTGAIELSGEFGASTP
jgi:hypothetical protein